MNIEIREAIAAGESALADLADARRELLAARGLGLWDTFAGGGLIVTAFKYRKLNKCKEAIERAKYSLSVFSKELRDVDASSIVDMGTILTVCDFLDSFVGEFFVQLRMADADRRLEEAEHRVREILADLR